MARTVFKPHKHQWKALASKARYVAVISGVQGGKTTVGAIWLAMQVQADKKSDYLVVFPTYRIGEQSTIKKFLERFPRNWGKYIIRDKIFRLKGGGNIYFRSAEDPQSLEGITAKACWIDEAGQINALAWETIQARLSIARGRAFITTTPYAMNWLYHDFYKKWEKGDPNYDVVKFRSIDSPYFSDAEYNMRKSSLDRRRFALKYEGEFTKFEGLVYQSFSEKYHVTEPYPVPKGAEVVAGLDYGHTAPTAILWAYKDKKGNTIVFREYYKKGASMKSIAAELNKYGPRAVYVDPSAKGFIVELQNVYGVRNIVPADNKVEEGISRVQSMFEAGVNKQPTIKIFKSCRKLIDELETYHYKQGNDGMLTEKVVKKDDHACDALRYLLHTGAARKTLSAPTINKRRYPRDLEENEWGYGMGLTI